MKKLKRFPLALLTFILIVSLVFCSKDEDKNNENAPGSDKLISKNFNIIISSSTKNMDTASVDVDSDGIRDFRMVTANNQYSIVFQPAVVKMIQIERLHDNIEFAYTLQYSNSNGFRLYNFGSSSLFLFYAKAFSEGKTIDSSITFAPTQYYCTSNYIFSTAPGFSYNETIGDFSNATRFAAFRMTKADGKHYGWIKLSNSNNCTEAALLRSGYSTVAKKEVAIE